MPVFVSQAIACLSLTLTKIVLYILNTYGRIQGLLVVPFALIALMLVI